MNAKSSAERQRKRQARLKRCEALVRDIAMGKPSSSNAEKWQAIARRILEIRKEDLMVHEITEWDGRSVDDIMPMLQKALEAKLDGDRKYEDTYWFDEMLEVLSTKGAIELWPDDLSDAFDFYAIDENGFYLCRDKRGGGVLKDSIILESEDEEEAQE